MTPPSLRRLRQALEAHRRALQERFELLSIPEVCQALGTGKSGTYRRIKSGEIPSVKLVRAIKVRREGLEEYLKSRRYRPEEKE